MSEGRGGGRGRGEWRTGRKTVDCWKFCYYARHCFLVNQLASFLPSPVLHSQQLNSCQLMLVFATSPSPSLPPLRHPWLTIFVGYCYILMRIYFSICVRECAPLTPNCRPPCPQFPTNFHCHLRQALPLFLLREEGWGMVLPATSPQSVSGPVPVPTPTSFISVVFYSFKHR